MGHIASVTFRGKEVDVEYVDHGWEPDTNAHVIDWNFIDDELNQLEMTDEEEQSVYTQLWEQNHG